MRCNQIQGVIDKINLKMKAWKKQPKSETETYLVAQMSGKMSISRRQELPVMFYTTEMSYPNENKK